MPKPYEHLGRGAEFRTKTREDVTAQYMAGYSEEEIREKNKSLTVEDIKAIIEFQSEKDPDNFEKLRKWRQKSFIDQAWNIISIGQDIILKGLENKRNDKRQKLTLSSASQSANIVILMIDRIRAMESQSKVREKKFTLTREEKEDMKKAQIRIEEKSTIEEKPT